MKTPEVSVLTVNYGHAKKIMALFETLEKFPPKGGFELIVVDNATPGNEAQKLEKNFHEKPNVHLIALQKNIGFGRANNEAAHFAHGKYIAIINPDILVGEGCLDTLVQILEKEKNAGIVTPLLQNPDGSIQENAREFPSILELFWRRVLLSSRRIEAPKSVEPVAWAHGSFLLLTRTLYEKLGGFDDRFFLFFEDTDLCRRTWELKKRVLQIPTAHATHGHHRLSGGHLLTALFKKTFYHHLASAWKYYRKYAENSLPKIY